MISRSLVKLHWLLSSQLGIDLARLLKAIKGLPVYYANRREFKKRYSGALATMPCLHDRYEEGGATSSEYFWQDLLVAQRIFSSNPHRHVDIGSRVDGFVANVGSFREIEVFDVRPVNAKIPGVKFVQADMMAADSVKGFGKEYCDSISCLHALEHFGLGRYGDPVDPLGYERGVENITALLVTGGVLYLSVPVGIERVEFDAHRIFNPNTIIGLAGRKGLELRRVTVIKEGRDVTEVDIDSDSLDQLAEEFYNLGIFEFEKTGEVSQC